MVCASALNFYFALYKSYLLLLFIYKFYTWLIVIFCLVVNALCERNVAETNTCVHLNVIGE